MSEPSRGLAFAAVGAGGAIGALSRWGVDIAVDGLGYPRPYATLTVNVVGCLLMGLLVSYVLSHPARHGLWRPFLAVGVLGGFTTFSAFALDIVVVARDGHVLPAIAYLVASTGGALLALWAGFEIGHALGRRRNAS